MPDYVRASITKRSAASQPCWTCETRFEDCPWIADGTGVPGWIAKATENDYGNGRICDSMHIAYCPKYTGKSTGRRHSDAEFANVNQLLDFVRGTKAEKQIRLMVEHCETIEVKSYGEKEQPDGSIPNASR